MPETVTVEQENTTGSENTQGTRTFTQEEVNAIVEGRIKKESAKYSDYEELRKKASKFDEIEEANKTELQKITEKNAELEKKLNQMTKENELRSIRDKVSVETGVPSNLLSAETEEECKAQAEAILNFANKNQVTYPDVTDKGEVQNLQKKSEEDEFTDWFNEMLNG